MLAVRGDDKLTLHLVQMPCCCRKRHTRSLPKRCPSATSLFHILEQSHSRRTSRRLLSNIGRNLFQDVALYIHTRQLDTQSDPFHLFRFTSLLPKPLMLKLTLFFKVASAMPSIFSVMHATRLPSISLAVSSLTPVCNRPVALFRSLHPP